jgi:superfamily I DNA/RNA helicase
MLCLSFTNKACEEISAKYREMHGVPFRYPHVVATIDSFLTQYIVMPFWYLNTYCHTKPTIVNEKSILHTFFFRMQGDDEFLPNELKDYRLLSHTYAPEDIEVDACGYKIGNTVVNSTIHQELLSYCRSVFSYKLDRGVIKSSDALWLAYNILRQHPCITQAIANRFPFIIIDEAQDTSELQFSLFKLLREHGAENIEFVGDLNQSIYEWRNAKPDILDSYAQSDEWNRLDMTENRRSVQRIIDFYSRLKPITSPPITSHKVQDKGIQIEIMRYDEGEGRTVLNDFLRICEAHRLESKLVLARGESDLKRLSATRTQVEPWKQKLPYKIINAQILYSRNEIKDALNDMKWVLADLLYDRNHFNKKKEYVIENEKKPEFNGLLLKLLSEMPPLSSSFEDWYCTITLLLQQTLNLKTKPNFIFKQRMPGYKMNELKKEPISSYFGIDDKKAVKAQTIHSVKGASVDAVLLFLNDKCSGKGISIKDIPNQNNQIEAMNEKHRLIYVACSRAKQFLAIAVPSTVTEQSIRQRFAGLDIHLNSCGVQLDLFKK